jgi:hypothetical protein
MTPAGAGTDCEETARALGGRLNSAALASAVVTVTASAARLIRDADLVFMVTLLLRFTIRTGQGPAGILHAATIDPVELPPPYGNIKLS